MCHRLIFPSTLIQKGLLLARFYNPNHCSQDGIETCYLTWTEHSQMSMVG